MKSSEWKGTRTVSCHIKKEDEEEYRRLIRCPECGALIQLFDSGTNTMVACHRCDEVVSRGRPTVLEVRGTYEAVCSAVQNYVDGEKESNVIPV